MYRFGLALGHSLPKAIALRSRLPAVASPITLEVKERYSTQANDLKKILPELWPDYEDEDGFYVSRFGW